MPTTRVRSLFLALVLLAPIQLAAETPEEIKTRAEALLTQAAQKALRGESEGAAGVEEALKLYRGIQDRQGEAMALVVRSMAAIQREDYGAAIADQEAAINILETAGDRMTAALFLYAIGITERLDGKSDAALAHLTRSANLLGSVVEDPHGASFDGFLFMARLFAGPSALPGQFLPIDAMTPMLAAMFEAAVRDEMGGVLIDLERLDEAEAQLARALPVSRLMGGVFDMSLYAHLGDLRRRQWHLEEAKQNYERSLKAVSSLKILPLPDDARLDIKALGRLTEIESLLGRPEQALEWNAQALALTRKEGARSLEASVLEDRGDLLQRNGRVQEAETTLEEALRVAREAKDAYREASVLANLGDLSLFRGAYEAAATRLEASRTIFRRLGKAELEVPTNLLLAGIYLGLHWDASAASALAQAREVTKKDNSLQSASGLQPFDEMIGAQGDEASAARQKAFLAMFQHLGAQLGPQENADFQATTDLISALEKLASPEGAPSDAELQAGLKAAKSSVPAVKLFASFYLAFAALQHDRIDEARAHFNAALADARRLKNGEFEAYSLIGLGLALFKEGKSEEGLALFRTAMTSLESSADTMRTDAFLTSFFGTRQGSYALFISQLVKTGHFDEAFVVSERARARAFLHQMGNRRVASVQAGDPALAAHADALRRSIAGWEDQKPYKQGIERTKLEQDIAHAEAEHEGLMTRLEITNPEYTSLVRVAPLDVAAIQQNLAADQTLVSYFMIGDEVHAWVLSRSGLQHVSLELDAKGREDVLCYSAELGRLAGSTTRGVVVLSGCPEDKARATRLYQRLFAPLKPLLQSNKLLLVPHGPLHYLPFAALQDPGSGQYLLEQYTVSYLPSASVLPFLRAKQSSFEGRALVLGAPAARDPELISLTGAALEAQQVAVLWGTQPWLGAEAKESRLYGLAGKVDLIHLAAHGVYNPSSSFFTHIALAPDKSQDGNLEVQELLSSVDLTGVNLVVLSACETALGKQSEGDEIVSLARAMLYAGSPAVVSTLWPIGDAATVELMTAFYGHLRGGMPAAEALRQAQLDLRKGGRFSEPWNWGAFTLTGELTLQPQTDGSPAAGQTAPPAEVHP